MKKLFLLFLLLPFVFVSCGSDDDDPTAEEQAQWIIGDWISDTDGSSWAAKIYQFDAQGNYYEYLVPTQAQVQPKSTIVTGQYRIPATNKLELKQGTSGDWKSVPFGMGNKNSFKLDGVKYLRTNLTN